MVAGRLVFDGVDFSYGRNRVLRNFSWQVPQGRTALLGPNGAGKSTLLAIGASGLRPRRGRGRIDDYAWPGKDARGYRSQVGWMPQHNEFVPHLTVRENVMLAAWLKAVPRRERADRCATAIQRANLEQQTDHLARRLSGGQRRRLCFAQAIVHAPPVVLLDEPTVGLDPAQREGLRRVMASVTKTDFVVSTHQVDDIDTLFDTVVVIQNGTLVFEGTTTEFLALAPPGDRQGERAYLAVAPDIHA